MSSAYMPEWRLSRLRSPQEKSEIFYRLEDESLSMVELFDSIKLLFETSIEEEEDRYVISIPKDLLSEGSLSLGNTYRVALLTLPHQSAQSALSPEVDNQSADPDPSSETVSATNDQQFSRNIPSEPPVEEGEIRSVNIDSLGDQGDGIAKVERGFVVIVSDTQPGDQLKVKITDVKSNVAFAEPVTEPTVR